MEEKRRFSRIDDSVFLAYKVIAEPEVDALIAFLGESAGQRQKMQSSMAELDGRINELLPGLEDSLPDVAALFQLLNSKVKLLSQTVARGEGDNGDHLKPSHKISVSVGGVSFHGPDSVRVHDYLEISLTLFPEYYTVTAVGRVVGCREALPSAPEFNKLVAVEWVYLHEDDRQYTISHVLKKQAEDLRRADPGS